LIWCAEDSMVPLWVGRRLARVLPRAQLSVLKGCGHVPQEELPATTRSLIRAFMSD
jgi:pimeloyl-ACP methyl ester carboxylesterase